MNARLGHFAQTFVFPTTWLPFCMIRTTVHMLIFSSFTFTSAEHLKSRKKSGPIRGNVGDSGL